MPSSKDNQRGRFGKICLSEKHDDILQSCFQANTPVYLLATPKKPRNDDENGSEEPSSKKSKLTDLKNKDGLDKDERNYRDLGEMGKNVHTVQDWIFTGAKYKEAFIKEVISSTPLFNDSGVVVRNKWFVRGFCYEKSNQHHSHKKYVSASHKSAYDK